jgi:hypothetical protein
MNRLALNSLVALTLVACSPGTGKGTPSGSSGGDGSGASGSGAASSGGGASGTSGGGTGSNDGAGGGIFVVGPPHDSGAKCDGITSRGETIPLDLYIMFDRSASMTCPIPSGGDRWAAVKTALTNFVNDPGAKGIEVGIQYFGDNALISSCLPSSYETPDVELGLLPGNAQAIADSLNRHVADTNTPTLAGLSGAVNHAITWRDAHLGHTVVVVLVTDGQPNACGTVQDIVSVAGAALSAGGIPTYVIGITSPGTSCVLDPAPPNVPDLDQVALAGGTDKALVVDATQNPAQQFLDTMNQIRGTAQIPCQYQIPPPSPGKKFDKAQVQVHYTDPSKVESIIYKAPSGICDPTTGGWKYDDEADPKTILLCPATCDTITAQAGFTVNIILGCETERPPA